MSRILFYGYQNHLYGYKTISLTYLKVIQEGDTPLSQEDSGAVLLHFHNYLSAMMNVKLLWQNIFIYIFEQFYPFCIA